MFAYFVFFLPCSFLYFLLLLLIANVVDCVCWAVLLFIFEFDYGYPLHKISTEEISVTENYNLFPVSTKSYPTTNFASKESLSGLITSWDELNDMINQGGVPLKEVRRPWIWISMSLPCTRSLVVAAAAAAAACFKTKKETLFL